MASHINDLIRLAAGTSLGPVSGFSATVTMTTANAEYSYPIPKHARKLLFSLLESSAWRCSFTQGVVAAGGGTQIAAGGAFTGDGPFVGTTLYFSSSVAARTMNVCGEQPTAEGV